MGSGIRDRNPTRERRKRRIVTYTETKGFLVDMMAFPAIPAIAVLCLFLNRRPPFVFVQLSIVMVIVFVGRQIALAMQNARVRASIEQAADAKWRVCPYCEYVLFSLPDEGMCPECGEPYNIASVTEWWKTQDARIAWWSRILRGRRKTRLRGSNPKD